MDAGLHGAVEIRTAGDGEAELAGELEVVFGVAAGLVGMEGLDGVEPIGGEAAEEGFFIGKREADGMREGGDATGFLDALYGFGERRRFVFDEGGGFFAEHALKGFIDGGEVALADQHTGEVRAAGHAAAQRLGFLDLDVEAERLEAGGEAAVAVAALLITAGEPFAKFRGGLPFEEITQQMRSFSS